MRNASARRTPRGRRGLIAGVVAAICGVLAPAAVAVQPPHPSYFGGEVVAPIAPDPHRAVTPATAMASAGRMVVDASRHILLVADAVNNDVAVFSINGGSLSPEPAVALGDVSAPSGLAIDQASELLYVSDSNGRIVRYKITGGDPATYTLDPSFTSPEIGGEPSQIGEISHVALAVDPTTHDLLVADPGNHRVERYTSAGSFVRSFDGSTGTDGAFVAPTDIAVGADGTVYVTDSHPDPNSYVYGYPGLPDSSNLERFSPTDASLGDVPNQGNPEFLAFDDAYGTVQVASQFATPPDTFDLDNTQTFHPELNGFVASDPVDATNVLEDNTGGTTNRVLGIAVDPSALGSVFTASTAGVRVWPMFSYTTETGTVSSLAPGVSIEAPTGAGKTGAHLSGIIDTHGVDPKAPGEAVAAQFEYSTDRRSWTADPELGTGYPGGANNPDLAAGVGGSVSDVLTNLNSNQTYYVRLVARRTYPGATPSTVSRIVSLTTSQGSPGVVEGGTKDVGSTTATLSGLVNPFGLDTSYRFEWGLTDTYGNRAPAGSDGFLGHGQVALPVSAVLSGLQAGTIYHYRLVAINAAGTTYGSDKTLSTDAASAYEARGYEQISPVDKGPSLFNDNDFEDYRFNADGSTVLYPSLQPLPGGTTAGPLTSLYVARRGEGGWSARSLAVPFIQSPFGVGFLKPAMASSPDLSKSLVYSDVALAPGAVSDRTNLYLEDTRSGDLQTIAVLPFRELAELDGQSGPYRYLGGTRDWSHLYVELLTSPLEGPNQPFMFGNEGIYDFHDGKVNQVFKTEPGGAEAESGTALENGAFAFKELSLQDFALTQWIYRDGTATPVSVSQRAGDPSTVVAVSADPAVAAAGGSKLYFTTGTPLTEDAPSTGGIYRYDLDGPKGSQLSYVGPGVGLQGVSSTDGSTVVYVDGTTQTDAALRAGVSHPLRGGRASITPDGRYVVIQTSEQVTDDPVRNEAACGGLCSELYEYDLDAGTVACVSCGNVGVPPTGVGGAYNFSLADDGRVFFYTAAGLVASDVNNSNDVYVFKNGHVHLISSGAPGTTAVLHGATPSGSDVLFVTTAALVPQDTDNAADVYDARIGGGFPAPASAPGTCEGEACRGGGTAPPALPVSATITFNGPGNQASPVAPAKVSVAGKAVHGSVFTLTVKAPVAGEIKISGALVGSRSQRAVKAGSFKLRVSLTAAARKRLKVKRRLAVKLRVTFLPTSGASSVATATLTAKA
jgi:hypothetical protein